MGQRGNILAMSPNKKAGLLIGATFIALCVLLVWLRGALVATSACCLAWGWFVWKVGTWADHETARRRSR